MKKYYSLLTLLLCMGFMNCKQKTKLDFITADIDSSIQPSEDFFLYANGKWLKNNPIPAAEHSWGVGNLVEEELYERKRKINEKAVEEKALSGTLSQKIADFWQSGMDSLSIEKDGLQPLQADMNKIDKITSTADITPILALLHKKGIATLFNDYVAQDDKNSEAMAYQLAQGGLGMPNRDYYFNSDAKSVAVQKAYQQYLFKTCKQLGNDSATASINTKAVYNLELKLAKASRKLADLRDPYKNYNKITIASLQKLSPSINWLAYLKEIGIYHLDTVLVGQPEFYAAVSKELQLTPLNDWKNYLRISLVHANAAYLNKESFDNLFNYRKAITGVSSARPRWKRVLDAEESAMGEALGQLFVKEYFTEKTKERYSHLVEAIREAYKERINKLAWMSERTKTSAIDKLNKITKKVGYPDKWKDFTAMRIGKIPFVLNMENASEWWHQYNIHKLGKPVDRTEWDMTPQTYNAYYNPSNNEIVLPAGMFAVPGMRDEDLDDAFVYGYAAASTIGHEITHGFDDQGRQYDAKGNLQNWWQPNDSIQFSNRAAKIIKQFNEFMPVDTLHINGSATQGENIADLGGLLLGIDAFKKTTAYSKGEKINGLTPLQRYFLGYAYSWMMQERKESLSNQLKTDVHAPAKERVNGPLANIPEFYEAFNISPNHKMYRADSLRVNIW